jgi:HEAT repeat protein
MNGNRWVLACLVVGAGVVFGCSPTQTGSTPRAGTTGVTGEPANLAHRDPIARSQMREKALDRLTSAISSEYSLERANALEGLLGAPTRLAPIAALGLADENEGVRSVAAMVVGRARIKELTSAVRSLQYDESPFVVASTLFALDALGTKVDPTPLGGLLFDAESTQLRAHAAFTLGEMGDDAALPMLADAARRPTPGASVVEQKLLELQIAEAMIKLGDRNQLDSIRAALLPSSPDDLEATALAVQIIGSVNDRKSIDRLIYLSAYKDSRGSSMPPEVMLAVAGSLGELGERGGSFIADRYASSPNEILRAQVAHVYGQIGRTENLGKLETLAADDSGLVQIAASSAILRILGASGR